MPFGHGDFAINGDFAIICAIFFCVIFFFMILAFIVFFRRGNYLWDWGNSSRFGITSTNHAEEMLKIRLAKGEINEMEYDILLKKIRHNH